MFFSTRNQRLKVTASKAILQGLSQDGGLFLPDQIKILKADEGLSRLSYPGLAYKVLKLYLDDFSDEEIKKSVDSAYDKNHFEKDIVKTVSYDKFSILELFHGKTLTFKDMALSLLPYLMSVAKSKHPEAKDIKILTATSGDTGSAVLSSFSSNDDISVSILYPEGGISPIQEKQMLYFTNDHARAYSLKESNFDTCQSLVKSLLIKGEIEGFTSANSINIGRLLPQIIYYYYSYLDLVRQGKINLGDKVDYVVPTGNFGDIFAGYLAKKMSLPIGKLVVASNENRILTDFFKTGIYDLRRPFIKTSSPSMDILISSNFERLLYYVLKDDSKVASLMKSLKDDKYFEIDKECLSILQEDFVAYSCSEKETFKSINDCYGKYHQILDPHSAVGYHNYEEYSKENPKRQVVLIATASPLKFPKTICQAFNLSYQGDEIAALKTIQDSFKLALPDCLKKVLSCYTPPFSILPSEVEDEIFNKHEYKVTVPATSANLGPGFDVMGLGINLFNSFSFEKSDKDELVGFPDLEGQPNLVYQAYQEAFKYSGLKPVKVKISQLVNDIPLSRGLGSSSSCIIAGLIGANYLMHKKLSVREIYDLAVKIEGHPDNVAPCLYGGLIANLNVKGSFEPYKLEISPKWRLVLIIPKEEVSTLKARAILPKEYPLNVISQNVSHSILLPLALKNGDIGLLRKAINDIIHVPYRKGLIADYESLEKIVNCKYGFPMTISGSGSTMIVFYLDYQEEDINKMLVELKDTKLINKTRFIKATVNQKGASAIEEDITNE